MAATPQLENLRARVAASMLCAVPGSRSTSKEQSSMARRRYQKGSVILRGSNWYGRYRESVIGSDGREIRIRRSVILGSRRELPTKRLAERRLEVFIAPVNSISYRPGRVATLEEFAERWKIEILSKRKPSTIHAAESHLRNQILPLLGKIRLSDLGTENQQMFVTRLSGTVSRKTLLNVLGTLSSMLRTAQNWGYVSQSVSFSKLALPERSVREQAHRFSAEQVRTIIAMATGQYRVMFAIAAMTGLRAGEILGFQVRDFDFEGRLLHVRRSVWRGKPQTPKSVHSEAVLPIPLQLVEIVKPHIESLQNSIGWLFVNSRGHLFIAENVVRQALAPILDALKIPRCGFHAFRHTHTSLLLQSGAPVPVAQAQLRHSDPRVTIGIYGHIIGDDHREAVARVASLLDPNGPNAKPSTLLIQ
jgi:integrase